MKTEYEQFKNESEHKINKQMKEIEIYTYYLKNDDKASELYKLKG